MDEVVKIVSEYCSSKHKNPFVSGGPNKWCTNFLKRHAEIRRRKPQHLQMVRARASTKEIVSHFFNDVLLCVLNDLQLHDKVYNADETFLALSGGTATVRARKGSKAPQRIIGGSGREDITIHVSFSPSGQYIPPYVVYKGKRLMLQHTQYIPPYVVYKGKRLMLQHTQGGPIGNRFSVAPSGNLTGLNHHFYPHFHHSDLYF